MQLQLGWIRTWCFNHSVLHGTPCIFMEFVINECVIRGFKGTPSARGHYWGGALNTITQSMELYGKV